MSDNRKKTVGGQIVSLTALLAAAVFLILGFTMGAWHIAWVVFLAIPIVSIIVDIVVNRKDASGKISGIVSLLCVAAYMLMGFVWGLWHPGWIIFLAIPISGVIVKIFTGKDGSESEPPNYPSAEQ